MSNIEEDTFAFLNKDAKDSTGTEFKAFTVVAVDEIHSALEFTRDVDYRVRCIVADGEGGTKPAWFRAEDLSAYTSLSDILEAVLDNDSSEEDEATGTADKNYRYYGDATNAVIDGTTFGLRKAGIIDDDTYITGFRVNAHGNLCAMTDEGTPVLTTIPVVEGSADAVRTLRALIHFIQPSDKADNE